VVRGGGANAAAKSPRGAVPRYSPPPARSPGQSFMKSLALFVGLALLAPLALPHVAAAQSVFPDKNLEKVVRKYVFAKKNNEEPLTADDVKNISTIEGKNSQVTNLAGLEHCISLKLLDLEGNEVSDLAPLKDLKEIQSLNLASNKITSIAPLAELTALQYLQLDNNQIEDLSPLAKMDNMMSLYLANNKIKNIEILAKLPKIHSLYLEGNEGVDLKPLAELKRLSSLDLSNTGISDLSPLAGHTEIRFLMLSKNKLTDLTTLVEMAKKDSESERRFSPFWRIYLGENPLTNATKGAQVEELKKLGGKVFLDQ
jgi:internalin A